MRYSAFFLCICTLCSLLACQRSQDFIKIKGSDSVLPISQKEAEVFMEKFPQSVITVTGGGSGVGIAALLDGTTHIAMSSREIKMAERLRLQDTASEVIETVVGFDALAVVVHPNNPITQLTRTQIAGIYTGEIKNWKELGGKNQKIVPYARETSSGTYEFFKEIVLGNREYHNAVLSLSSNGAIMQSAQQTEGAIGYIGLAYLNPSVKALLISFDEGKTFVAPTFENAQQRTYPILRPLYYYYIAQHQARIKRYLNFVFSPQGQSIIKTIGYIPANSPNTQPLP